MASEQRIYWLTWAHRGRGADEQVFRFMGICTSSDTGVTPPAARSVAQYLLTYCTSSGQVFGRYRGSPEAERRVDSDKFEQR